MEIKKQDSRIKGQGLVEFAFLLVLVALVVLAVLYLLGPSVGGAYSNVIDAI